MNARWWRGLGVAVERLTAGLICLDPIGMAHWLAYADSGTGGRDHSPVMAGDRRATEPVPPILLIEQRPGVRRLA